MRKMTKNLNPVYECMKQTGLVQVGTMLSGSFLPIHIDVTTINMAKQFLGLRQYMTDYADHGRLGDFTLVALSKSGSQGAESLDCLHYRADAAQESSSTSYGLSCRVALVALSSLGRSLTGRLEGVSAPVIESSSMEEHQEVDKIVREFRMIANEEVGSFKDNMTFLRHVFDLNPEATELDVLRSAVIAFEHTVADLESLTQAGYEKVVGSEGPGYHDVLKLNQHLAAMSRACFEMANQAVPAAQQLQMVEPARDSRKSQRQSRFGKTKFALLPGSLMMAALGAVSWLPIPALQSLAVLKILGSISVLGASAMVVASCALIGLAGCALLAFSGALISDHRQPCVPRVAAQKPAMRAGVSPAVPTGRTASPAADHASIKAVR